jgi:hypothetical protein
VKLDVHTDRIAWNEGVREEDAAEDIWARREELQEVGDDVMICTPHIILSDNDHEG